METDTKTLDCGHPPTITDGVGTGYGTDRQGRTACYACATVGDLAAIESAVCGDRMTQYVSTGGGKVVNWPGSVLMAGIEWGAPHVFSERAVNVPRADVRRYFKVYDAHGRMWSGIGAPGMYALLRLTKVTRRNGGKGGA